MPLLEVNDLTMHYQTMRGWVQAVDDVSFALEEKQSLGLAGESGCGKTSAALSILKLLPWNAKIMEGSINLEGKNILKLSEAEFRTQIRWKKVSMIFQGAMNALHPTYTVGHQIAEAILKHEKVTREEALQRAKKLIELVGMESSKTQRYPHELSGGMKQRAVTAMALACNPVLVIADEPTTALDVIVQAQVLKVMKELRSRLAVAMIVISHDLSLIAETCDHTAIMYAGKIVEKGSTVQIYKEPLHPYTTKLISAFPSVLGPKMELSSIHGFPPDLLKPPTGCRFHPRCEYAMEICRREQPELMEAQSGGHMVACFLHGREKA